MSCKAVLVVTVAALAACSAAGAPQTGTQPAPRPTREVPFELVSSEIRRFKPPIRIDGRPNAITYDQALVFTLRVNQQQYDALPPDIEPFFYVGAYEMRTFRIDRPEGSRQLTLTFHARDWDRLIDGAPMVLTIDHGAPARDPKRFENAPRFRRSMIVDRR